MTTIVSPLKQSLIILGTIIIVAGITFSTLMISRNTSRNYLQSKVWTQDITRDNALKTEAPSIVTKLDSIIATVKTKVSTYSSATEANAFIDRYLARVSDLEDAIMSDPAYSDTYSYLFSYIYPRIYEMKKTAQAPAATLNVTTCTIPVNQSSCSPVVSGTISNLPSVLLAQVGTPSAGYFGKGNGAFTLGAITVDPGTYTFQVLAPTTNTVLVSQSVTIACVSGSSWDTTTSKCVVTSSGNGNVPITFATDYMTTPGNCTDSTTPTCDGSTDTLVKDWTGAVAYCDNMTYGTYSDWILPNKDQLNLLYTNKNTIGGFNINYHYWSNTDSTTFGVGSVFIQRFENGLQVETSKIFSNMVRCIRKIQSNTICANFTYSNYGACQSNNTQTRTILTSIPSGCTDGSPETLTQSCTYAGNNGGGTSLNCTSGISGDLSNFYTFDSGYVASGDYRNSSNMDASACLTFCKGPWVSQDSGQYKHALATNVTIGFLPTGWNWYTQGGTKQCRCGTNFVATPGFADGGTCSTN